MNDKIENNFLSVLSEHISLEKSRKINEAIKLSPTLIIAACDFNAVLFSAFLDKLEPR